MKKYEIDIQKPVLVELENNECVVETAGFIPLEVKFKQFENAGIRAQFNASEFDSADMKELYLNPDYSLQLGDDMETVMEKMELMERARKSIIERKNINKSNNVDANVNEVSKVKDDVNMSTEVDTNN